MELFDTHTHLNSPDFANDLEDTINRAHAAGVRQMMVVGYDPITNRRALEVVRGRQNFYAAVGIHPHDAKDFDERAVAELAVHASDPSVVALGEVGLDFYRNLSPKEDQEKAFKRQIRMAREMNLPLIIHSRDAYEQVIQILKREKISSRGGVMHCFTAGIDLAKQCIDLGLLIGLAGPVTYKKNEQLRQVAREIPAESLLIETDCPYLSPEPLRGKRNEPAWVAKVAEVIARERKITPDELGVITTRNAEQLFLRK
jgi:TatD DNase family protein